MSHSILGAILDPLLNFAFIVVPILTIRVIGKHIPNIIYDESEKKEEK